MPVRVNKEIKHRTRVATLFPNKKSLLRLVIAILMEINEDWKSRQGLFKTGRELIKPHNEIYKKKCCFKGGFPLHLK